jgi:RNA polymerase sigma-70 factor, ECF subfamily
MNDAEFATAVETALKDGRQLWPDVQVVDEDFAGRLRTLGADRDSIVRYGSDLFFAHACARSDPMALKVFERRILPSLDRYLRRCGIQGAALDDARQKVRMRLFSEPNPRIVAYAGRGSLQGWLRVVATRVALDMVDSSDAERTRLGDHDALGRLVAGGGDPELGATKSRMRASFQAALDEGLAGLSARAKTVLRLHYVDGLNIDAIAAVYHVHRATVARWLVAIRSAVLVNLREKLSLTVRPTSSDFRSLAAALRDELHISMDRVLATAGAAKAGKPGDDDADGDGDDPAV